MNCRCGHDQTAHQDKALAPQCARPACTCLSFRSVVAVAPAAPASSASRPPMERCTVCNHGKKRHEVPGFGPACAVGECECIEYTEAGGAQTAQRPAAVDTAAGAPGGASAGAPQSAPVAVPTDVLGNTLADALRHADATPDAAPVPASIDDLVRRGLASELAPIARLASRIAELAEDLHKRLADEAAADGVKSMISELERKLADARAQLRGIATGKTAAAADGSTPSTTARTQQECPDCGKSFSNVGAHQYRAHGRRKDGAA